MKIWKTIKEDQEQLAFIEDIKAYYRRQAEKDYAEREAFMQRLEASKND